jgi:hypothetical protein
VSAVQTVSSIAVLLVVYIAAHTFLEYCTMKCCGLLAAATTRAGSRGRGSLQEPQSRYAGDLGAPPCKPTIAVLVKGHQLFMKVRELA